MKKFLLIPLAIFALVGVAHAQSDWNGGTNGDYGTAANWTPLGVPGSSANLTFGQTSGNTSVSLGGNRTVNSATFASDANAYSLSGFRLTLASSGYLNLEYGLANTATINSDIGTAGAGISLNNNSLSPSNFVINGNLTNSDGAGRLISLGGLGGGSLAGNIQNGSAIFGLLRVGGGGVWTFSGTNTSTAGGTSATTRLFLANGATLIADATSNNGAKLHSGQQIQFTGGNLELRGNTSADTTATANGTTLTATSAAGSGFGFGSTLTTVRSGSNNATVALGAISRDATGVGSYLRILGNGTVTTTSPNGTGNVLSGVFVDNDFATKGASDSIVAYSAYSALPASGTGGSSTVFSVSGTHSVNMTSSTAFNSLGIKADTTGIGQSLTFFGTATQNILAVANSAFLFVGSHDYTITATTFGRADAGTARTQTLLNTGTGVLTMNASINTLAGNTAVMQFGGPGTTVLTLGATGTAGSVRIAEGIVAATHGDAFGSTTPSVSVQSGGTLELRNNITLSSGNTLNLHGLGNGGNGALRNLSGANTVAGNIVLGITSRIKAEAGSSLTLSGSLSGVAGEFPTAIFGGAGNTTVSGEIQSTINSGLVKEGAGVLNLTRAGGNSYLGGTTVSAGTLLINNGSGSGTGTGMVQVASAGTLGGNGSASGAVNVLGTLAPGNSIGVINTGDLTLGATGTLDIELGRDGTTPVGDRANVTGSVSLLSGANLELTLFSGLSAPAIGDIFFLVSNDGADPVSGVFTHLNSAATPLNEGNEFSWNFQEWKITYLADFEGLSFSGGKDIALQVVPEPATAALAFFGLSALLLGRRRREA